MSLLKRIFHLKEREVSRTEPGFEEMERKTPKTGIILLIIMFALGLSFGWVAVDDLARVPAMPPELSSCSNRYLSEGSSYDSTPIYSRLEESYPDSRKYFYDDSRNCQFNDLENQNGIPALISKRLPLEDQLRVVSEKYNNTQNTLQETRRQVQDLRSKYGIGLEEKQANIPNKIFPVTPDIQNQILKLGETEKGLEQDVARYNNEIATLNNAVKQVDAELAKAFEPVFAEHNRRLRWFEFKVFLLQALVVLPIFLLAFRQYIRFLRKNSPYSIIFTGIIAVAGVLLARVILVWIWGLFLANVIEILIRWISNSELLRSLIFYGGMIMSFVIFGGAVYYLQRKIFDPRRVIIRRFRSKQCPHCQANLDLSVFYCPNCGYQIKEKCEKCGQARFISLPSCPYCGSKK